MAFMASLLTARMEVIWLLIIQTLYAYYLVLRLPKGIARLFGLMPVLAGSVLVPWRARTTCERLVLSFLFLWMINTKLLLLAWDMGLAADPSSLSSLPRFFFALTLGVHLKRGGRVSKIKLDGLTDGSRLPNEDNDGRSGSHGRLSGDKNRDGGRSISESDGVSSGVVRRKFASPDDDVNLNNQVKGAIRVAAKGGRLVCWVQEILTSQPGWTGLLQLITYFTVVISLLRMLQVWRHLMPKYVLVLVVGFYLYFGCLLFFEGAAAIPTCLLGMQLRPQFNMPYLADSLADFWGRRWNLPVNNLLRVSVYDPVLGLLNGRTKPTEWARAVSTGATFLVSGLMHELIIFYGTRSRPSWEMTTFFVLNGAGTILEGFVLKTRERFRLPTLLAWAYTMCFVYSTAYCLFVPPFIRNGIIDTTAEEVFGLLNWVVRADIWPH